MVEFNAAADPGTFQKKRVAASITMLRKKEEKTEFGGYINFDQNNRFTRYQQLARSTSHVSVPIEKLGLSLTKGMQFDGRSARAVKQVEEIAKKTNLIGQFQTIGRLHPRDGTYIAIPKGNTPETFRLEPLLLSATTLLPEGLDKLSTDDMLQPEIEKIMINEGGKNPTTLKPEDAVLGVNGEWDFVQEDIKKRQTYGLYGKSILEPLELTIQNYLSINFGYVQFVKKYGAGRYHIDFEALGKLVENDLIEPEKAQELVNKFLDSHQYLEENEDMATFGVKINPLDAKGALDVLAYKESLEVDLAIGLFQSPVTMGKAEGTTYASSYIVEDERLMGLEGLQKTVTNIANQGVRRLLTLMRKDPDLVEVQFEELSRIKMSAQEVLEWYNSGVISKQADRKSVV